MDHEVQQLLYLSLKPKRFLFAFHGHVELSP